MEERLPRRLIHISDDNENIRLCLTEDIDVSGARLQYATLTHCWGRIPMPILATRENLDEMLCRIPFESLTKTFQDAIKIARRLGFQYLWIDTLCILQGDVGDWMSEAVMMGSIYASCSLNIVASASPEGSIGCFFDRDTELHRGLKVLAFTEEKSEQRTILNCMPNNLPLYGSFTAKRAWCFQETFLAPRSLSFHRDQIYWQCRVFTANETFPQGLVHEDPPLRSRTYRSRSREQLNSTFEWFKLVNMYSSGQLTYWKDKLIAMSGVARFLSKDFPLDAMDDGGSSGQSYLAGLWKSDLASQLLWCMSKPCPRQYPQSTPSWSWASVDG
ncbi:heterokaryon incompatibility protein-domain-containing protein, partial [Bisporella sp. PMI_857]